MPVVIPSQVNRIAVPQNRSAVGFAGKGMMDAATHQKSEAPGRKKTIEEIIQEFMALEDARTIYEESRIEEIQSNLIALCKKAEPENVAKHLGYAREIFAERKKLLRQYVNVGRQELEIRKYELNPGKIFDAKELMNQMTAQIPQHSGQSSQMGWTPKQGHGFGDRAADNENTWSFIGGSKAEVDRIRNTDAPKIRTEAPSKAERNNVIDARIGVLDDIKVNDAKINHFAKTGEKLNEQGQDKFRSRNEYLHRISNLAESFGGAVHHVVKKAGKGTLSHSKASEDSRYSKYNATNKQMISEMITRLGPNSHDGALYIKARQKANEALKFSENPEDRATYSRMKDLLDQELAEFEKQNEEDMKKFTDMMNELNSDMLEGLQKHVDTEDDAFKWQVMCAIAVIAPFAPAIMFIGPVFSYLTPLTQLFGPVFIGQEGFAHGIASIVTSPVFGPFSKLTNLMQLDTAIEWSLNNTPLVNSFTGQGGVIDFATRNPIFEGVASTLSPLTTSSLTYAGIGAAALFFRGNADFKQHEAQKKFIEDETKKAKDSISKFAKNRDEQLKNKIAGYTRKTKEEYPNRLDESQLEEKVPGVASKRMKVFKQAYVEAQTAKAISGMDEKILPIFNDMHFKAAYPAKLKEEGKLRTAVDVIENLYNKESELRDTIIVKTLLFMAVADAKKSPEENLAAFNKALSSPEDQKKLIAGIQAKFEQEYIQKEALRLSLTNEAELADLNKKSAKDIETKCTALEAKMIDQENLRAKRISRDRVPDSSAKTAMAKGLMHGQEATLFSKPTAKSA